MAIIPARMSLVIDIPAGNGKIANLFLQCIPFIFGSNPSVCWYVSLFISWVSSFRNFLKIFVGVCQPLPLHCCPPFWPSVLTGGANWKHPTGYILRVKIYCPLSDTTDLYTPYGLWCTFSAILTYHLSVHLFMDYFSAVINNLCLISYQIKKQWRVLQHKWII